MKYHTHAIYQRGECHIQNSAHTAPDGTLWAAYTEVTAAEYCAKKNAEREPGEPEYEVIPFDEAMPLIEAAQRAKYQSDWKEITKQEWWDALEVLPPEKWQTVAGIEIFRMCEYLTGTITAHYARLDDRYFVANRCAKTGYEDIAAEVYAASLELQPA